jgi:hypothetical protein
MDTANESVFIVHIVTDEDGNLNIEQLEDFRCAKVHPDLRQAMAAQAKKQCPSSFAR